MVDRDGLKIGRSAVVVDTSMLYALVDRDDQHYEAAKAAYRRVALARRDLVTTNFVLVELHSLITNR